MWSLHLCSGGGASQNKSTTSTVSSDDSVQFSQMQVRLRLQVSIDGLDRLYFRWNMWIYYSTRDSG